MKKRPFVTLEKLKEIEEQFPTPFHLYDEKGIRENAKALKEAFAWNKGFKEFFAVKATPNPYLIQILQEYGCGCDCSSMTELMMAKALGCKEGDIMFSSNDTPEEEFRYADEIGGIINLDDITHIEAVERATGRIPKTISCRYNPGGLFKISNDIMDNPGDSKYGMTTDQIFEAFRILKEKGAENFGIHAFLASNTVTNEYYPMLAKVMFELAVKLQKETGAHISFINLSGGIGIPYSPDQKPNDIRVIGEGVRKVYEEVLVPAGMGDVAIYTELGRFMMGPYGCLVTKAIHEKHTHKEYIGVDACAVNLMRPAMYGAYHHITVMGKEDQPCDHLYDVTGSLCENNDKFAIDRYLPQIDKGDLLVIHDTGAHGFAMGYNYNGKLKSAEILLHEDGSFEMIRRAETAKDYFATFDCFPIYKKLLEDADRLK
ncbi:diaminopimelate decarboxylase [Blautia sp. XA-2221]|uniref:diaminopimelate decarboxylase n=1 Tax=Blautia sp. XA-2221 TaxID=2903961 RepID=UPI0023791DB1|nr:diaminopimelate decarboxylase [Blautia sp. XA-2221]